MGLGMIEDCRTSGNACGLLRRNCRAERRGTLFFVILQYRALWPNGE